MRLKPTNSTCTSQPAEVVDDEIIPAQFRPSLEARSECLFHLFTPGQNCTIVQSLYQIHKYFDSHHKHTFEARENEWFRGNKNRIRVLLGVVASTQHIAEQVGRAGPEGQLVLDDVLLCF